MNTYLGIGGNEDESIQSFKKLIKSLKEGQNLQLRRLSSVYLSKPWGVEDQNDFLNFVIQVKTDLEPKELLEMALNLELELGRNRQTAVKWGPRLIDIDILLYGDNIIEDDSLNIPHPHITSREFVYIPLLELDPNIEIPKKGRLRELVNLDHDMKTIQLDLNEA